MKLTMWRVLVVNNNNNNNLYYLHLFLQLALHFLKEFSSVKGGGGKAKHYHLKVSRG